MKLIMELVDLLMPSKCAICESSGSDVCRTCINLLIPKKIFFERQGLQGRASFYFDETISKLLSSFKERGQVATVRLMSLLLRQSFDMAELSFFGETEIFLVPAPSRWQNFRDRGYQPSLLLAQALAKDMNGTLPGHKFRVLNCLVFSRDVLDQAGLNQVDRKSNIHLSMLTNQLLGGRSVYLVDDTVTTGSTAIECQRALQKAGGKVLGILAFAVSSSK
jgi:predicted amidophosphoribosyltransferase